MRWSAWFVGSILLLLACAEGGVGEQSLDGMRPDLAPTDANRSPAVDSATSSLDGGGPLADQGSRDQFSEPIDAVADGSDEPLPEATW
jgi:hypothetical protein